MALDTVPPTTPKGYIDALNAYLLKAHGAGESCVLIIDEAQNLAPTCWNNCACSPT